MSCCDEFGNCRQGRDCPVRVAKVAAYHPVNNVAGGNVWFDEPEPPEMTRTDRVIVSIITLASICTIFGIAGWIYQHFFGV